MAKFRVMNYHLNGLQTVSSLDLCAQVIREQNPDLVLLQGTGTQHSASRLKALAREAGLLLHQVVGETHCAYLSHQPLHNLQRFPLGFDASCIRADYDLPDERVHLYNFSLSMNPVQRLEQVKILLSEELLNNTSVPCAAIIGGDFGLPLWGCGKLALNPQIVRSQYPDYRANYPSVFPLWGRGRIYFQGPILALGGSLISTERAKQASSHLPLLVTVETRDTRKTIKVRETTTIRPKRVDPVCG